MMIKLCTLLVISLTLAACAYGIRTEAAKLPDGRVLQHTQFRTHGEGVQVTIVDSFLCAKDADEPHPVICNPYQHTAASGNSLIVSLFNGAGTAILGNMAYGVPAAVLRPSSDNVSQSGGGASATGGSANSTAGSDSSSNSNAEQSQSSTANSVATAKQNQQQMQSQQQQESQQVTQTKQQQHRQRRHR